MSWIKLEQNTPDKPEVANMAEALGIDQDAVVGKLLRLWIWADQNSLSGNDIGVTKTFLDRISFQPGFADALLLVGWLHQTEHGYQLPNFDRHNGQTAKKRALSAQRMARSRARKKALEAEQSETLAEPKTAPPDQPSKKNRTPKRQTKDTHHSDSSPNKTDASNASPKPEPNDAGVTPLCTIAQARSCAEQSGHDPEIAETWWNDSDARGWLDAKGHPIRRWRSSLASYSRKWIANQSERKPASRQSHPEHSSKSKRYGF